MSLVSLNQNCCNPCANLMRAVQGQFSTSDPSYTGGDVASMNAWVNAYDMDTLEWGSGVVGYFAEVGQTEPAGSLGFLNCGIGDCYATDTSYITSGFIEDPPCAIVSTGGSTVTRTQYLLPFGQSYFVYALAYSINNPLMSCFGGVYLSVGCYSPATGLPTIVELPIVTQEQSLDPDGLWLNYVLGIIDPGVTSVPNLLGSGSIVPIIPSLSAINSSNQGYDNIGPYWADSIATVCAASPEDPFLGDDPP